jgi:hypothetical protein
LTETTQQSLLYGGALLFPLFKKDSPAAAHLPMEALPRYGVIGKDCIDRMAALDRWNCIHIPQWNPCAEDFLYPKHYYIPFLGAHVSGERCARVVTAPQAGCWAVMMPLGWDISDIPGWIEAALDYYSVMKAIPAMIRRMSLLIRTLNGDGALAMEGPAIMNDVDLTQAIKHRSMFRRLSRLNTRRYTSCLGITLIRG